MLSFGKIYHEPSSGTLFIELKLVDASEWEQDVIHNQVGHLVFYDVTPNQDDFGGDNRWGRISISIISRIWIAIRWKAFLR